MKVMLPGLIAALAVSLFAGCNWVKPDDTVAKLEALFRQQLAESEPVKTWKYSIKYVRFTKDNRKALIVFTAPVKGDWEFNMMPDEFGRFRGQAMLPFPPPDGSPTPTVVITVVLPEQ